MGYQLTSEATGVVLPLNPREWEMLLKLAAASGEASIWEPEGGRDYTRGKVPSEEASRMAASVTEMLRQMPQEPSEEPTKAARRSPAGNFETWTKSEMLNHLGYTEENPLAFFSIARRRRMAERFVQLAAAGAFEVLPVP